MSDIWDGIVISGVTFALGIFAFITMAACNACGCAGAAEEMARFYLRRVQRGMLPLRALEPDEIAVLENIVQRNRQQGEQQVEEQQQQQQ